MPIKKSAEKILKYSKNLISAIRPEPEKGGFGRSFSYLPQPQDGVKPSLSAEFVCAAVFSLGGKNSDTGKRILRNESQGLSVSQEHSFDGIQKSYAGISICTSLSSCTIENTPIVTRTALFVLCGPKLPLKARRIPAGIQFSASGILLQQSQGRQIRASRQSGSAT